MVEYRRNMHEALGSIPTYIHVYHPPTQDSIIAGLISFITYIAKRVTFQ